ncbi:zinc-ribbon domain-containing protein [Rhodococcus erythropolis]
MQGCATDDCPNAAAFTTRTKPAWCIDCIDEKVRESGLEPTEAFTEPKAWRLTTCRTCGVQAHYRLDYIVDNNASNIKTCRACFWTQWASEARNLSSNTFERNMLERLRQHTPDEIRAASPTPEVRHFLESGWWPRERIINRLSEHGFDFIATTVDVNDGNDPVVAQCRACKKIRAARMGDFGWGCTCSRNSRSSGPSNPRPGRILLTESKSPALQWWDHESNDEATLGTVTVLATRLCRWHCIECGHRFEAKVKDMTARPLCPKCVAIKRAEWNTEYIRWKTTPVAEVPELLAAWADDADPQTVMVGGGTKLRRFTCKNGHHPRITPLRYLDAGCPHCRGVKTSKTKKWVADLVPEIAAQWHPTRNGKFTPQNVVWDSRRTMWWQADCCGHTWQESVRDRDKYQRLRCPSCRTILGSLAWHDPGLAAEWSAANPISAWQVRPNSSIPFIPEWICATNTEHVWRAPLSSRSNGAECPECREVGKSRIELAHFAAAEEVFGDARSGSVLRDDAFTSRRSWTVDISVTVDGRSVVMEYDGAYWHEAPAKVLVDERKSLDLLLAGFVVIRLREDDLPTLGIDHPRYREVRVHSTAPRPRAVMDDVQAWLKGLRTHK